MQNKSKSWADIQMIISSIAVAVTMGFWSLFSSNQKLIAGSTGAANLLDQPEPTNVVVNNDMLLPGQVILLNGPQNSTPAAQQTAPTQRPSVHKNNGGGGGSSSSGGGSSGGGSHTGSSKP